MTARATYRCDVCPWSARRVPTWGAIECPICGETAHRVGPTRGPPPAPDHERRVELRVRPLARSIEALGAAEAREIARQAVDQAAQTRRPAR